MTEFFAPSGKKVVINPAPFKDAMALKQAIASEFANSNFKMDIDFSGKASANIAQADMDFDIAQIGKLVALMDSSPLVYEKLLICLSRCLYDGEKIIEASFEPVEARGDYYDIVFACMKENLAPFLKGLVSKFAPFLQTYQMRTQSEKSQPST